MEDLIKMVSEKTGLPPEKAKLAVDTVVTYIKEKLPAGMQGLADSFLNSQGSSSGSGGDMSDMMKGIGGMFGEKKV